jgi:polyferredoxin
MIRWLRWFRLLAATAVFLVGLLAFGLGGAFAQALAPAVAHTQFVPSLLRLLATGSLAAGIAVLAILLITLLAGRWYCSFLCPLGVLQDIARSVGRLFRFAKRRQDRRRTGNYARRALRTWVLVATIVSATAGSMVLLNLLDPYSVFGRTAAALVRPPASSARHGLSILLEKIDVYALSGSHHIAVVWALATLVLLLVLLPVTLAFFRGRLYCNSICPVGALLAALSRFSAARIRTKDEACTGCGLCARVCRADCVTLAKDDKKAQVDTAECVLCLDCLRCCPENALVYGPPSPALSAQPDGGRRELLALGAAGAAAIVALPLRSLAATGFVPEDPMPIVPPGGIGLDHFTSTCTGCHLCVAACPSQVIQPRINAHGSKGLFQPALDFLAGACNYECNICSQVCPNGALVPLSVAAKKRVQIGTVQLHESRCVVYKRGEECGACIEVCPTHAVYGQNRDGILYPMTESDYCIGCGACQYVCPQNPRAITVDAMTQHATALDPHSASHPGNVEPAMPKADPNLDGAEDFPF